MSTPHLWCLRANEMYLCLVAGGVFVRVGIRVYRSGVHLKNIRTILRNLGRLMNQRGVGG